MRKKVNKMVRSIMFGKYRGILAGFVRNGRKV